MGIAAGPCLFGTASMQHSTAQHRAASLSVPSSTEEELEKGRYLLTGTYVGRIGFLLFHRPHFEKARQGKTDTAVHAFMSFRFASTHIP
ncbi:hypothetical protein LX36DRAFT_659475, partial [Colletotrichum falcatum]